ncbi:MAG TPA: rod shape-determining protein MreC, partial [Thermoanaerobaculia bacterium]|nr:rod shape-determining protein MreC [Thermoanaerobaculia bacterium]
ITDRASGVGAMVERTRRQGIVRGAGRDGLALEYVPLQADVQVGDRVLSSGTDGLYPRGVPIGTVVSIEPGGELFHSIRLAPAADFGMLDQVFVLLADSLPGRLKGSTSASP